MTRPWREWPDWSDRPCIVVASGPTAATARLERAKGKARVLVVNEGWRLCPWADALYAHDFAWWACASPTAFSGLKIAGDPRAGAEFGADGVRWVRIRHGDDRICLDTVGEIGSGGNSGFQALNLALGFGARRIALVGFDMTLDRGVHWHGRHQRGLKNPTETVVALWRKRLDAVAESIARAGAEVINASPHSALTAYRKAPLEDLWTS